MLLHLSLNFVSFYCRTPTAIPNGTTTLPNGSSSDGRGSQLSAGGASNETKDGFFANKLVTVSVQPAVLEPPAPIPAQSFGSLIKDQEKSTSNSNPSSTSATSTSVSGVCSSAADPVLAPTVSRHAGAVSTIKHEIGNPQEAAEVNHTQGNKHVSHDINVSKTEKAASEVPSSMPGKKALSKSKVAEQVQQPKTIEPSLLQGITSFL